MHNNVGCSASFEIRQKNVIGRTFIQWFYPWALTQPERFEDKKWGGGGGGDRLLFDKSMLCYSL